MKNSFLDLMETAEDLLDKWCNNDLDRKPNDYITTFWTDYDWLKPNYELKDKGDKYQVEVHYNDDKDYVRIRTDKKKHTIHISVFEDFDKAHAYTASTYYGSYTFTAPEDCILDKYEKTIDEENKMMVITFEKTKAVENKKDEPKVLDVEKQKDDKAIDYKALYNDLLEKYHKAITEYDNKMDAFRNTLLKRNDEVEKYKRENIVLKKKLEDIKKMFN